MSDAVSQPVSNRLVSGIEAIGRTAIHGARAIGLGVLYVGGIGHLLSDTLMWLLRGMFVRRVAPSGPALAAQMVRVGVRSIPIIVLVQTFIGIILALQLAPTLEAYGALETIATIVGIAMFRELSPLLSAIPNSNLRPHFTLPQNSSFEQDFYGRQGTSSFSFIYPDPTGPKGNHVPGHR